ncbi:MAG: nucleotidyltransferase domain-containing protein [Anaerolineae bacterium]|nr:nucleotidyltransferase domain-containing protein [Anaerolineae bacterium]
MADELPFAPYREYHQQREAARLAARESLRQERLAAAQMAVRQIAPQFPSLVQVYLFGSIVQPGRFTQYSDIDVAVVGLDPAEETQFWRLLEQQLQWAVDVRPCVGPIQQVVYQDGKKIYVRKSDHSNPQH